MIQQTRRLEWRTFWLAIAWLLVAAVVYLSLEPSPPTIDVSNGDKVAHILAYAAMMFWFAQIYEVPASRTTTAIGLVLLGIALEFLQGYGGIRSFEVADMVADAIGVGFGWIAASPRTPNVAFHVERLLRR